MSPDDLWLVGIAWRLDRLRWVPREVLHELVARDGACMEVCADPPWSDDVGTDRELAGRMCAGCPVQDECLEVELRAAGEESVGVWGALGEDDRRVLHAHWLCRGERVDGRPA
jgi:WhiB family transcriptional regulator, redox-sensing transcriptional regulator